jgi:hypothetical protein
MSTQQYGKYTVISKAGQKTGSKLWFPHAGATWRDANGWHYQQFNDEITYDTVNEAIVVGFSSARAWIEDWLTVLSASHFRSCTDSLARVDSLLTR